MEWKEIGSCISWCLNVCIAKLETPVKLAVCHVGSLGLALWTFAMCVWQIWNFILLSDSSTMNYLLGV